MNKSSELMTISTPNDHYYQSKESTRYSRKRVQEIIESAIKAGNDPYLTLAIVMTENPPVVSSKKVVDGLTSAESYATSFGKIPLDALAVADTMGCDRETTGYDSGLIRIKNRSPNLKKFVENPKGKLHRVCMYSQFANGEAPQLFLATKENNVDCCMLLTTDAAGFVPETVRGEDQATQILGYPNDALKMKILDILAHKFMKNRFASAQQKVPTQFELPEEKMAYVAQSFNGLGRLGVTESIDNKCLSGVHMGRTPIYGAGTSEIMLNSLMNNSEIKNMVTVSLTAQKKTYPESYLCGAYGSGTHTVSGYAFTGLLGNYMAGRKSCSSYTNKIKNLRKFATPQSAVPLSPASEEAAPIIDAEKPVPAGIAN
jgi:hypothetical protein